MYNPLRSIRPGHLLATLLLLIVAAPANGQTNTAVGRWRLSFFNDNTPGMNAMAIQNICILPNGTWYGIPLTTWRGRWFQKGMNAAGHGDRVRILGNYANGVGNDGADLNFVNVNTMAGFWAEWRDFPNSFFVWATVTLTRAAPTCPPMPAQQAPLEAREAARNPLDPSTTP